MADMSGRTCLVTGATSGIGRAAATALARRGADLVILARDRAKGERTLEEIARATGNRRLDLIVADLASLEQVRRAAHEFLESGRRLHVLLNNAGLITLRREVTPDGYEKVFAVNHLAHFLLTRLLLERLRESAPARVVTVASAAHGFSGGGLEWDDLQSERGRFRPMRVYGRSKLANILFTRELARRLEGTGVVCHCLHPGFVGSSFGVNNGAVAAALMALARPFARSPERGADTAVFLCTAPEVGTRTGGYWIDRTEREPKAPARDDAAARRLWQVSERLVGLVDRPRGDA